VDDEDDGIEVGDTVLSLVCPISLVRIRTPGRGRACKHVQAFSIETFLELARGCGDWRCGICRGPIAVNVCKYSFTFILFLSFLKFFFGFVCFVCFLIYIHFYGLLIFFMGGF
jgi:hypothetical protein